MENVFYVYIHKRNDTNAVFYVGKGKGKRAYWNGKRNRHWHNVANKRGYSVEIVKDGMMENEAFSLERELIAFYGRSNLCNYTDGGDGSSGSKRTHEQKEAMRERMLGREILPEWKKKMSEYARNKPLSHRRKQAEAIMGRKHTDEHKRKISESCKGRILTDDEKRKISDFHRGRKKNPEAVRKMALSKSKKVICLNSGIVYESQSDAARKLGLSQTKVSESMKNGTATKGFRFEEYHGA